jgi:hypothetical protein
MHTAKWMQFKIQVRRSSTVPHQIFPSQKFVSPAFESCRYVIPICVSVVLLGGWRSRYWAHKRRPYWLRFSQNFPTKYQRIWWSLGYLFCYECGAQEDLCSWAAVIRSFLQFRILNLTPFPGKRNFPYVIQVAALCSCCATWRILYTAVTEEQEGDRMAMKEGRIQIRKTGFAVEFKQVIDKHVQ